MKNCTLDRNRMHVASVRKDLLKNTFSLLTKCHTLAKSPIRVASVKRALLKKPTWFVMKKYTLVRVSRCESSQKTF